MWGKVSCLRKQYDGRDWASNHQPSDLKSNALTTTPPLPFVGRALEKLITFYVLCEQHLAYLSLSTRFNTTE